MANRQKILSLLDKLENNKQNFILRHNIANKEFLNLLIVKKV